MEPAHLDSGSAAIDEATSQLVTPPLRAQRIRWLDGIRGWAAVYVVASHIWDNKFTNPQHSKSTLQYGTEWLGFGRFAVSFFIVISGCSLGMTAWKYDFHWPGGLRRYARQRFMRIVPPYWFAIAFGAGLGATVLSKSVGTLWRGAIPIHWPGVIDNGLLLQDITWHGPAGSTAFWSIAIEFHIYIIFFVSLALLRVSKVAWYPLALAFFALTVLSSVGPLAHGNAAFREIAGFEPGLYGLFFLGIGASRYASVRDPAGVRRYRYGLIPIFAAGVFSFAVQIKTFNPLLPRCDLVVGPVAAWIIVGLFAGRYEWLARFFSSKISVYLGASSYSLYLTHQAVIELTWRAIRHLHLASATGLACNLVAGVACAVVFSRLFFRFIERPFHVLARPQVPVPKPDLDADRPTIAVS